MEPEKSLRIQAMDLKPCPFCGTPNPKMSFDDLGWGQFKVRIRAHWIQCRGDHCYGLQQGSTEEKVVARWNGRVNIEDSK